MSYQRIYFDFLVCAEACRITLSAAQIPLQDSQFRFADFRVGATLKRGEQECGSIARVNYLWRGIYYPIHCHFLCHAGKVAQSSKYKAIANL